MPFLSKHEEATRLEKHSAKMAGPPPPYGGPDQQQQAPFQQGQFQQQQQAPPSVNRQFPPAFNLYTTGVFSRGYVLGPHQDQTIYYVSTHKGWSGQPDVVLHSGPSEAAPPIASATLHTFGKNMDIELPPAQPGGSTQEAVAAHGWWSRSWTFSIEVSGPKGLSREQFEWKHQRGGEVAHLGGAWSGGWRLTRMGTGEVVAVCAVPGGSLTKRFAFEFHGSGASGVLGERFAVMAAITGLGVFETDRRTKSNSTVAGASAAA